MKLYKVKWYAVKTGKSGTGTKGFPKDEAQGYADELTRDQNREYPLAADRLLVYSIVPVDND